METPIRRSQSFRGAMRAGDGCTCVELLAAMALIGVLIGLLLLTTSAAANISRNDSRRLAHPAGIENGDIILGKRAGLGGDFRGVRIHDDAFSNIPDGYKSNTSYLDNPDDLIIYTGESDGAGGFDLIAVRPHAFSDDWSFERAHKNNSKNIRDTVVWFGQGITTGSFEMVVSSTTPQSKPFVIYTEKGFIGIVPSSPLETRFIFEDLHIIFSLETGFSQVDSEPEPPASNHFWQGPYNYREI